MIIEIISLTLLSIVLIYVSLSVLWPFVFSLKAWITKSKNSIPTQGKLNKILVMIPAYKEDGVILNSVKDALRQNYPLNKMEVLVIADSMREETLGKLRQTEARLIEVNFENSNKSKALNYALQQFENGAFDIAVVLDGDNHMCPDFLQNINAEYNLGKKAIQGQRIAKNDNGSVSALDGLSEIINNHIYCKGQYLIGGSSRLSGSGMAFCFSLFKEAMSNIDVINGFDKYLELEITKTGERISYCEQAKILDDKVAQTKAFKKQRTRWLAAQYICLTHNWKDGIYQLIKNRNWDFAQKIILLALPPKLLFIPVLGIMALITALIPSIGLQVFFSTAFVLSVCTYLIAIPASFYSFQNVQNLLKLPLISVITLGALLNLSKAKEKFLHTEHNTIQ